MLVMLTATRNINRSDEFCVFEKEVLRTVLSPSPMEPTRDGKLSLLLSVCKYPCRQSQVEIQAESMITHPTKRIWRVSATPHGARSSEISKRWDGLSSVCLVCGGKIGELWHRRLSR